MERKADWSCPAGADDSGVRRPAVGQSYSIMGPKVNLVLLVETRCRNEHFYVFPNRVTERFNKFSEKTFLVLRRICSKRFTSVIRTSKIYVTWKSTLSQLTTDKCQYIIVTGLNYNWT